MKIQNLIYNLFISLFIGSLFAPVLGTYSLYISAGVFIIGSIPINYVNGQVAYAGLLKEVWTDVFMQNFFRNIEFLKRSRDMSVFVENNTINLAEAGVNPNVLINNTTYPIPTVDFTANPIALPLDYYDTENTIVRNALQKQYSFDALSQITYQHQMTMKEKISDKTVHAWSPAQDTVNTPVFATSGADRGNGFKKFSLTDIAKMQEIFDQKKYPKAGRILVLHSSHRTDLLNEDKTLFKQFSELKSGQVLPLYGFEVYEYSGTANYNKNTGVKIAFGAAPSANDSPSSLFYLESEVMHAEGDLEIFFRAKGQNPDHRGDQIGFQKRFLALPIRGKAIGAVYSAAV
jgi:hypothetical protein